MRLGLEKLEEMAEAKKEEDPVFSSRQVEQLFAYILMWTRDQQARKIGASKDSLFFPNEPEAEFTSSLKEVEKGVEKGRLGYQRNMKLSMCLKIALDAVNLSH